MTSPRSHSLAVVEVKAVETGIEWILFSGTPCVRPDLRLNLTDLSINRKSHFSLRLCGNEGGQADIVKCLAQDLAWCQPELLRAGRTRVSVVRFPIACLACPKHIPGDF